MCLAPWQWAVGAAGAALIGVSKTGIPGAGILVVSLLAITFGGRSAIGIMLPMLIFADIFAVAWYRRHAHWDKLVGLLPWVVVGMAAGALALYYTGKMKSDKDVLGIAIGVITLTMLGLHLARGRLGDKLTPTSPVGVAFTGTAAGFATTVSNAAGSIMTIYMAAHKVTNKEFIGTLAWYFFIVNVSKVPVYLAQNALNPAKPVMTMQSVMYTVILSPAILLGVFVGKWMLPRISPKAFEGVVLTLAAVAAVKLIVG